MAHSSWVTVSLCSVQGLSVYYKASKPSWGHGKIVTIKALCVRCDQWCSTTVEYNTGTYNGDEILDRATTNGGHVVRGRVGGKITMNFITVEAHRCCCWVPVVTSTIWLNISCVWIGWLCSFACTAAYFTRWGEGQQPVLQYSAKVLQSKRQQKTTLITMSCIHVHVLCMPIMQYLEFPITPAYTLGLDTSAFYIPRAAKGSEGVCIWDVDVS